MREWIRGPAATHKQGTSSNHVVAVSRFGLPQPRWSLTESRTPKVRIHLGPLDPEELIRPIPPGGSSPSRLVVGRLCSPSVINHGSHEGSVSKESGRNGRLVLVGLD